LEIAGGRCLRRACYFSQGETKRGTQEDKEVNEHRARKGGGEAAFSRDFRMAPSKKSLMNTRERKVSGVTDEERKAGIPMMKGGSRKGMSRSNVKERAGPQGRRSNLNLRLPLRG